MLAGYSAVAHSRYRGAAILSMPAGVLMLAFPGLTTPQAGKIMLLASMLLLISVLVTGDALRLWRRRASEVQARLARLQPSTPKPPGRRSGSQAPAARPGAGLRAGLRDRPG